MATTTATTGTSEGIPSRVRGAIRAAVLDLRTTLQEDFTRQLAALGVTAAGAAPLTEGRTLTEADARAREMAATVIAREMANGATTAEAFTRFVRECAFTFLNRAVGLRCLEERGLLIVDGQTETAVTRDPATGESSLYWRVRREGITQPRETWRETLRRAYTAISASVRVLFDPDSEYAALLPLAPTLTRVMDKLNDPAIPAETWAADELLGWVYQYFNADEKDRIFAAARTEKKKIAGDDIIPVTQLYTERYMVDYLLQNTLGALWVRMHPHSHLPATWPYYVTPPADDPPAPLPTRPLREITLLDPCCGSGHFLLRAFDMLAAMYREEGEEREEEIPGLILGHNLYGVDIDLRAVQITALALVMKARGIAGAGFVPSRLNLVAADVALGPAPGPELLARLGNDAELRQFVTELWATLRNVREFGSLIHPEAALDVIVQRRQAEHQMQFGQLAPDTQQWNLFKSDLLAGLREEFARQATSDDLGQRLFGQEAARGVDIVEALSRRYDVVVTNPPYMGSGGMGVTFKAFVEREYKDGKRDLYTAFILRCRDFAVSGGVVGMVTQQSWLFLRSFAALREGVLRGAHLATLAHLGPHAFAEIGGEVVNTALFTLVNAAPTADNRVTGFRLVGPTTPSAKATLLRAAAAGTAPGVVSTPQQADFLAIPETPVVYWLRPRFFQLLNPSLTFAMRYTLGWGVSSSDNDRFLRLFWEASAGGYWLPHIKGGGYGKWCGLESWVLDWRNDGAVLKSFILERYPYLGKNFEIKIRPYTFDHFGWAYSSMSRAGLGFRFFDRSYTTNAKSPAVFMDTAHYAIGALLNGRLMTFLARSTSMSLNIDEGYVASLPLLDEPSNKMEVLGAACVGLKQWLAAQEPTERRFAAVPLEAGGGGSLLARWQRTEDEVQAVQATLHALEGWNERLVCDAYELDEGDVQAVLDETGTPAGWFPLVAGYDTLPALPSTHANINMLAEARAGSGAFADYLRSLHRLTLAPDALAHLKARLRARYEAGPGAAVSDEVDTTTGDGEEAEAVALGARIPIPTETFLEELSQSLELHPLSVFWLLHELRAEGVVSPPEVKRQMEDWTSVTLMRLLGYRWPEEAPSSGAEGQPIIPLVRCDATTRTADELLGARLEAEFGVEGRDESEREFRTYVGRDLKEWLHRDFFKRHIQQFKQRPVVWHFVSGGHPSGRAPERAFEAFVRYHALSRETLQTLRATYAGGLIERLRANAERDAARASAFQIQIEEVEEFRAALARIERGETLKDRIRCRWKGETDDGRPGPYAPDLDDGVKVNIRPFQEARLLAVKEVIKKW